MIAHFCVLLLAGVLIAAGLVGSVVPAVPGIPLIFAGIWLSAWLDHFRHLGFWWLCGIACVGAVGLAVDLLAGALGARRSGASRLAVWGALAGSIVGLFFGIPGILFGPFCGALVGELATGTSVLRSAHVGAATWIGLILGTLVKLAASVMMVSMFGAAWWWSGSTG